MTNNFSFSDKVEPVNIFQEVIDTLGKRMACIILGLNSTKELNEEMLKSTSSPNWPGLRYAWFAIKLMKTENSTWSNNMIQIHFMGMNDGVPGEASLIELFRSRKVEDWNTAINCAIGRSYD